MLIESENLIARIDKYYQESAKTGLGLEPVMAIRDIKALISIMPTVDAAPVVHGKWIMMDGMKPPEYHHHHQCSICESYAPMRPPYGGREELSPWCPACGAKMDLEEQHD